MCKGRLRFSSSLIVCTSCGLQFPQNRPDIVDLLPVDLVREDRSEWDCRQRLMEDWYRGFCQRPKRAARCLARDYEPYLPLLRTLTGTVLDIGGGNGVVRHYLAREVEYLTIDPSTDWLDHEWSALGEFFPELHTAPRFVRAVGEYLPFPPETFDAALCLWSLNHASRPTEVLHESHRVLRPGGRLILILEDVKPTWPDLLQNGPRGLLAKSTMRVLAKRLLADVRVRAWRAQGDHVAIDEEQLKEWLFLLFRPSRRNWQAPYLAFEVVRQ